MKSFPIARRRGSRPSLATASRKIEPKRSSITSMKRCGPTVRGSLPCLRRLCGYFGYELRSHCGSPVSHGSPFPDAMLMRIEDKPGPAIAPAGRAGHTSLPQPRLSQPRIFDRIRQCIDYIRDGEAYESASPISCNSKAVFPRFATTKLCADSTPRYSAYLRFGDLKSRVPHPSASFASIAKAV